jgi:hypothetical protein
MNSLIVRMFVFVNEVLAVIILGLGAIGVLVAGFSGGLGAFAIALAVLVFFILGFGFGAMMIENHKLLKDIRDNTKH